MCDNVLRTESTLILETLIKFVIARQSDELAYPHSREQRDQRLCFRIIISYFSVKETKDFFPLLQLLILIFAIAAAIQIYIFIIKMKWMHISCNFFLKLSNTNLYQNKWSIKSKALLYRYELV